MLYNEETYPLQQPTSRQRFNIGKETPLPRRLIVPGRSSGPLRALIYMPELFLPDEPDINAQGIATIEFSAVNIVYTTRRLTRVGSDVIDASLMVGKWFGGKTINERLRVLCDEAGKLFLCPTDSDFDATNILLDPKNELGYFAYPERMKDEEALLRKLPRTERKKHRRAEALGYTSTAPLFHNNY